jgi:hypothetical protein
LENGDLKTITAKLTAVRMDSGDQRSNQPTFFNSIIAAYEGWHDTRNDGKKAVILGDGRYLEETVMSAISAMMREITVAIPWHRGDILLLDNRTVMHSRRNFQPPRRILASLVRDPNR